MRDWERVTYWCALIANNIAAFIILFIYLVQLTPLPQNIKFNIQMTKQYKNQLPNMTHFFLFISFNNWRTLKSMLNMQ